MTIFRSFPKAIRLPAKPTSRLTTRSALSIVVCLIMLATAGAASATDYWVSTTGSNSNPGTQSSPWLTFAYAASQALAGDTVIFMNGTYGNNGIKSPSYVVNFNTHSGTASNPIIFMAQHRGGAILDGGANGSSTCKGAFAYLNFVNQSYIVIQGFQIRNSCNAAVWDNESSTFITLRWNQIYGNGNGTGGGGFYCGSEAHDIIIDGNAIYDNGNVTGVNSLDHGIYTQCPNDTIINNIFYENNSGWDIQLADNEGEQGVLGTYNDLIANNTFGSHNPAQPGQIALYDDGGSMTGLTFQNNIFYNPPNGYAFHGYTTNITNCQINTNLISNTAAVYDDTGCTVGTNLLDTNPDMVDPADYNYALESDSPAIDAGIILGTVTTDFARACRPQGAGYDIGAYEYVSSCN